MPADTEEQSRPGWTRNSCPRILISGSFKITLRAFAVILFILAAWVCLRGGLAFRSEEHPSPDMYVIRHTVILRHSAIFPAIVGLLLLAVSFTIPPRPVDRRKGM